MKITFLGGADEVGASSILLEIGGRRLLVDAGIRPSPKAHWGLEGDQLPDLSQIDRAGGIDAVLVTHAHTDHTGGLELVTNRYPDIPVYATPVTIALTRVLHQDARRIMQTRLEEEGELPLFDDVAVRTLLSAFVPVPFHTRLPLAEGLVATFFPAGHIAGAAMLGLNSSDGNVLITGDISISPQRTVDGAKPPPFDPDVLILESTYGGRLHANRTAQERRLVETVSEVLGNGGKVLIPAFALGRAQELLLILSEFRRRGELPPVPVWADGMVRAICQAYTSFPEALPLPLQERGAVFFDEHIRPIERGVQRNALIWEDEPAVIVSSSGMLAGGPSLSYARSLAGKPQHAILLTGYQDEESPGRRLQEVAERGHGAIRLGKDKIDVQCRLGTYSLSAHADEGQLISLTEALDPQQILLVHGGEAARASLAKALEERGRSVHLPRSGQAYTFRFEASALLPRLRGMRAGRPLDVQLLWEELSAPDSLSPAYTLAELANAWWGNELTDDDRHLDELALALAASELYFAPDRHRREVYRVRSQAQVDLARKRRAQMAEYAGLAGQWLVVRGPDGEARLARGTVAADDHLVVEIHPEGRFQVWPEDVLKVIGPGETAPDPAELEQILAAPQAPPAAPLRGVMEPNQALAFANQHFTPEARLRRTGYRLDERVIILTFDFPAVASRQFADQIASLEAATGWQVEVSAEANQAALNSLVREVLPAGWQIVKGPAIHRERQQVAIAARPPEGEGQASLVLRAAGEHFRAISGFELNITPAGPAGQPPAGGGIRQPGSGGTWEINAAYTAIKAALAGTSLYRTSQKGDAIMLSFISPEVGERYLAEIETIAQEIGWQLSINPQPNQGAILEVARALIARAGWTIHKGPGIYPERSEVSVVLAAAPEEDDQLQVQAAFQEETGFRLVVNLVNRPPAQPTDKAPGQLAGEIVQIPLARIRLKAFYQNMSLAPDKLNKAIERARRMGQISPPVQVRRARDGYILLDGLYRLRAAEALGMEKIPALIE